MMGAGVDVYRLDFETYPSLTSINPESLISKPNHKPSIHLFPMKISSSYTSLSLSLPSTTSIPNPNLKNLTINNPPLPYPSLPQNP